MWLVIFFIFLNVAVRLASLYDHSEVLKVLLAWKGQNGVRTN